MRYQETLRGWFQQELGRARATQSQAGIKLGLSKTVQRAVPKYLTDKNTLHFVQMLEGNFICYTTAFLHGNY